MLRSRTRTCRSSCRHFKNMPRQNMREVVDKIVFFHQEKIQAPKNKSVSLCFQMFGREAVPPRSAPLLLRSLVRKVHRHIVPCQTKITSRNHGVSSKLATKPMFHALKQDHSGRSWIGDLQKWCLFQVEINVWHIHAAVFHLILVAGRLRRA